MISKIQKDKLNVRVFETADLMGKAAAISVAEKLAEAIKEKGFANLILATGASQFSFLEHLQKEDIGWNKITVFHLDEYKGMSISHPASFRKYLKERILDKVQPKEVHYLEGDADDIDAVLASYEDLLKTHPVDVACIGIGENGHIAFNDPPVADFNDPKLVKVVELDEACRKQQLGEGWFPTFDDVPTHALSLTIPAIMNCKHISCVVPDERKAQAVYDTLNAEVSTTCPATILRTHPGTTLFLDKNSASKL
ncbi:glucosamine-6-phosphate deaminase [Maribellus comscasis]|uniref:Glucosamine-6-phosphate deaminase n=1 Tax=Maribellus comscasis TaxID=2681766 RepID=A0A6I6JWQ7_9BACT|nr:glucosamine-6-phosphate deaminase [Maribellus comscasis]QGY45528.1 glucosamine-6-phosphate deaminase [Maribellus comscasis]